MIKKILNTFICSLFLLPFFLERFGYAQQIDEQKVNTSTLSAFETQQVERTEYKVTPTLQAVIDTFEDSPKRAEADLKNSSISLSTLNIAEQYVYLLIQGRIKQHYQEHEQAIALLEQAKTLSEYITKRQLNLPLFADLYLVLEHSLVAINDYENAYLAKKSYIEKFNDYSDIKRDETVALLTEKYELVHKKEINELLDKESKLKALQLSDFQKQQATQQRNFILIFVGILVFLLLFLHQYRLRKRLLLLRKTDSLTGLLNRAALFNKGEALVKHSIEQNKSLSVLLFDIDHFKQVNDDFGHQAGDLVLVEIATLVNETMRARDIFARLGGEEFVILLPDTDIDKAKAIAVRVTEKISQYQFEHLGINRPITLSIGVANIRDTNVVFDDFLHAADLAMYHAKKLGRNQMVNYATIAHHNERRQPAN